ncbi:hypothetical protein [Legionella waltersii]|uniref:YqaE/Pmp3 family membrane protein n=1 Tax=Legionella waltersii TaxID=66969 RepID=A0A0W1A5L2_9GAMM|nr:hypothetical protein [Legionella waltersii]KTD76641.1 hypothetical protein Lwal_2363 [Legionella waltersii]SNU94757.1 Uncharacterised protein [Legionella waltersii]
MKIKRILFSVLSVFLPWLVLLFKDNPGGALLALLMQATVIGWPFASIWAWRTINPVQESDTTKAQG